MKQLLIFTLGSKEKPATPEDIKEFEKQLKEVEKGKRKAIVVPFKVKSTQEIIMTEQDIEEAYNKSISNYEVGFDPNDENNENDEDEEENEN